MKLTHVLLGCVVFVSALFCIQQIEAGFSNTGRMQSRNLNLSVGGTLDNNGELIGTESAALSCDTFSGKGLVRSPHISIKTEIFAYTGKIDCSGECTIIAKQPFNEKMFKRGGGGAFIIVIGDTPATTKQAISSAASEYTITDELNLYVE